MSATKKKLFTKLLKKRTTSTVMVFESRIAAKDTLFPEKVAEAKKILRNTKFHDPSLGL
jgi:hypothetical protein